MNAINNHIYPEDFLNLLEDIAFVKDINGKYISCNNHLCDLLEKEKKDIIGKTDFDLFNEQTAQMFVQNDKEVINNGIKKVFTEHLITSDDDHLFYETTKDVIKNNENEILGIFGVAKNITAQKEYETLYKVNQKILEKTIEDLPLEEILRYIIKKAEKINPNMMCSILILDKNKKNFEYGYAPSLPDYYNEAVKTITIGEGVGSCGTAAFLGKRVVVEDINTHPYWAEYTELTKEVGVHACWSQPFFSKDKEVLGTFAIYYNKPKAPSHFELELIDSFAYLVSLAVNKRARLEKIKEQENLLVHQAKMATLGEMLENIAHQWRQPLSVISTVSSSIKIDKKHFVENEEMFDTSLDKILTTTKYLSNTINDFRTYFLRNKQKDFFNVKDAVNKSLNIVEAKFNQLNIQYILDVEDIELYTYENELLHIFLNILNNAKDALEINKIPNRLIFITIKKQNENCVIKIKDNGLGIKKEIMDKIFEPYFTTKYNNQGTGIGLYMVQDILTRHMNGNIKVHNCTYSYKNNTYIGAEFRIYLPLEDMNIR